MRPFRRAGRPTGLAGPDIALCAPMLLVAMLLGAPLAAQSAPLAVDSSMNGWQARDIGPAIGGGRVSAVVGIPGERGIYYVGTAGGGVWKTTNGGHGWTNIFENEPTSSIGAVALAPSNPNLVWVGTGEGNPRNDITDGHGVWFSPDGGHTWSFKGLGDVTQIPHIAVDPSDPEHVVVAALGKIWVPSAERGIYETWDGGRTWTKSLFVNDSTGGVDVAFMPGNPRVVFAAMWQVQRLPWELVDGGMGSGLYRSEDGGHTWTKLTNGLPKGLVGRIAIGVSPSDPERVYALVESKAGLLWESNDGGDHWHMVSDNHALDVRPFYFSQINVDPKDANRVFFASVELMESNDGGRTAHSIDYGVHPDHHALWIDPDDPNRMIQGNDGGVYVTHDGGRSWNFLDNLPIEQAYMVAIDSRWPFHMCAGLQDNSAWCGPSSGSGYGGLPESQWVTVAGGDGQYAVPAPSDSSVLYAESQNGSASRIDLTNGLQRSIQPYLQDVTDEAPSKLAYRFNWTTPIAVSPTDANTVYMGADVVFKSTDGGRRWSAISPDLTTNDKSQQVTSGGPIFKDISGAETYNTILSITLAPSDPDSVIWVGTDDGNIQYTRDGGRMWTNVRPNLKGVPPGGRISQIGVSPFDPGEAYVAIDRHMLGDDHPYVYKTTDWGRHWTAIDQGLPPDYPAHVVREDPDQRNFLALGTDNDVYYSRDGGEHWTSLHGAFPTAPVFDLKFAPREHDLVVATHGRGLLVLDDITPLEQMRAPASGKAFTLFTPLPGIESFGGLPTTHQATSYRVPSAPGGVLVAYDLPAEVKAKGSERAGHEGPVEITVLGSNGDTVDTFHGPGAEGIDRVEWNMHYRGAPSLDFGGGGGGFFRRSMGPAVLPGTYTIAVTIDGHTRTTKATVKPDPRVPFDQAAAQEQLRAGRELVDEMTALNTMLNRLHSMHEQLQHTRGIYRGGGAPALDHAVAERARKLSSRIDSLMDELHNPHVQRNAPEDDIHYLSDFEGKLRSSGFGLFFSYDEAPTAPVTEAMSEARRQLEGYLARFNAIAGTEVPAYNRLASQHGVPVLVSGGTVSLGNG